MRFLELGPRNKGRTRVDTRQSCVRNIERRGRSIHTGPIENGQIADGLYRYGTALHALRLDAGHGNGFLSLGWTGDRGRLWGHSETLLQIRPNRTPRNSTWKAGLNSKPRGFGASCNCDQPSQAGCEASSRCVFRISRVVAAFEIVFV